MLGYCWLCNQSLTGRTGGGLCLVCLYDLPRLPPSCLKWRCQQPERAQGRYWYAAMSWQADTRSLVHRFKFRSCPELAHVLAPLMVAQVLHCYQDKPRPDAIMAMPMSYSRWVKRGYNQAGLLARAVAEQLQLPIISGGLRRLYDTGTQQHHSSASQRWDSMQRSLDCTGNMAGLTIAVVDDVLTTGASISAAAAAIEQRGAKAVDAWTFAFAEPHPPLNE